MELPATRSRVFRQTALITLLALPLTAQPPSPPGTAPVLENSGKPMVPAFRCTDEDIQWAGLSCSDQDPCPVYLELSAVAAAGDRIFAAGNIHSETVTLYSILLGSADAGKTWSEPYPRIRGAGLDRIQFAGPANGWIGGETLFPLPQDPFLLITSDSGTTWRRQPLFSEPHPGSIQQFWFSSPQEGSLIVDRGEGSAEERYELYESPDGGQSWTVKQLSQKPIRLKAGPATAATWRVRADGPTQSFRIERHEGERWTAEASFAVNLGVCKPVPAEPPLPPSEPLPPGPASPPAPSLRRQHP